MLTRAAVRYKSDSIHRENIKQKIVKSTGQTVYIEKHAENGVYKNTKPTLRIDRMLRLEAKRSTEMMMSTDKE